MATSTGLTTVAEFENLPEGRHELRHGEVVTVPPPRSLQNHTQKRLVLALDARIGHLGYVNSEIAFRPVPEFEVWAADVAFISELRDRETPEDGWLSGAPDLVIEVLSPSNTAQEMLDREELCRGNGARQFWTVSAERQSVKITSADGRTATYRPGDEIDLAEFGGGKLPVSEIFAK